MSASAVCVAALHIAADLGLAATYDAHYLALAKQLDAELWTADARLVREVGDRELGRRGQITLPSPMRRELKLKEGDKILVSVRDSEIILRPAGPSIFDPRIHSGPPTCTICFSTV